MTTVLQPMDEWKGIEWKKIERNVFKLQKRIYRASSRGDAKTVHKLQRLLLKSRSAKLMAVRKVTQDNQGKKTAGIDGVKSLTPEQRLSLTKTLIIGRKATPVRRVWIPKLGTDEKRPLGIATIHDRALQTLVKLSLEPEWEAKFEPDSYGFRPGRSCHDAIEAIFNNISRKPKWVLDADIMKCFDRISQSALLKKLNTSPTINRQLKAWLQAGVIDGEKLFPTEEGVPQGGTISPLLMNIALHGLESLIVKKYRHSERKKPDSPTVIRYADDLVVLHENQTVIKQCQAAISEWLKEIGLELKPDKTHIVHTLEISDMGVGFDFLGFNIKQYPTGKTNSGKNYVGKPRGYKTLIKPSKVAIKRHTAKLRDIFNNNKTTEQGLLINILNPIIVGWANYYSTVVSKKIFDKIGTNLFAMLFAWATRQHPHKGKRWVVDKYWKIQKGNWTFQTPNGDNQLLRHGKTPIRRHTKVQGNRSPFDGDWIYWNTRLGRHPEISPKVAKLLQKQKGICLECGLFFKFGDVIEKDHIIPKEHGGLDVYNNLQLLHRHCHDRKSVRNN